MKESIAQTSSPVNISMDVIGDTPLTSLSVEELEALLEAAAYSLRTGQELKDSLDSCDTDSFFDAEFLFELDCLNFSRPELLELVAKITERLQAIEEDASPVEEYSPDEFTAYQLACLLEACGHALRYGQDLYCSLGDCDSGWLLPFNNKRLSQLVGKVLRSEKKDCPVEIAKLARIAAFFLLLKLTSQDDEQQDGEVK